MKEQYHYFYKITNNINNHFYYGVHNTSNLNDGYMGSGTRLWHAYKKYGIENFTKEILKFFNSTKEAFDYEAEVVTEELTRNENCYNIQLGGCGFNTRGLATVKDKNNNQFDVFINDPRFLSGELVGVTKGYATYKDKNNNIIYCSIDDPRVLSGELVGVTKGYSPFRDKNNNIIYCSIDDPKVLSGELVGLTKGYITVKDNKGNFYLISKDDERYKSGKLKPIWCDRQHSENTKKKMSESHKINGDQKGEKNSQYGTCWIMKDNENKKIKKEELEQYISLGWTKGRKIKGE